MIDAHLVAERPPFRLDLRIRLAAGEVVAVTGPPGAGKTTALRVLAGLTPPGGGHIVLDGAAVHARPPGVRPVGMLSPEHLLFPHLSALGNVAFGPRCRGASRAEARRAAALWLRRLGLGGRLRARPRELTPGEARLVALARTLAVRPRVLLLDEPLAALDAGARLTVRAALRAQLGVFDGGCVLVTGDPLDLALADRVLVVEGGALVQEGTPAEVACRPRTGFAARLAGLNLCRGDGRGREVSVGPAGGPVLGVADEAKGPVYVAFPPSAVTLRPRPPDAAAGRWEAVVAGVEPHGDQVRVRLAGPIAAAADLAPPAAVELGLSPGLRVWAVTDAARTRAYPLDDTQPDIPAFWD
ncbi:ABC transporter ATP-binding protein [Sphaerisporangium fuscum]|uniref:ABC transporter ATP-binding protein n=1 Tax=Sphaerisporangium fuscum TaxID=2835868 RepID=UPI001BDC6A2D|nr:ABC transporter ATP-binding protein [Sphaerisporangium fuscum]